jgi:hypothetical protein
MNSHDPCIRTTPRRLRCAALTAAACIGSLALPACVIDIDDFAPRSAAITPIEGAIGTKRIPLSEAPDAGARAAGKDSNFDAMTFEPEDLGYGPNQFYYLRRDPAHPKLATLGTISPDGVITDRLRAGDEMDDALVPIFDELTAAADEAAAPASR